MTDPIRARIEATIAAALAAPKTHAVVTTFANGHTSRLETSGEAAAETFAVGERRKVGRDLILLNADLTEGPTVRCISVTIEKI